jgi:hypothetical protein
MLSCIALSASLCAAGLFKSWVGDLVGSDGQLQQHIARVSGSTLQEHQQQQQQQQAAAAAEVKGGAAANASSSDSRSSSSTMRADQVRRWGKAEVSADLAVLLQERYNAQALYPYGLDYSGGKPLPEIEYVVTVRLEA